MTKEDEIKYLKNMHTKGQLARMFLEARQNTLKSVREKIEKLIKKNEKIANRTSFVIGIKSGFELVKLKLGDK